MSDPAPKSMYPRLTRRERGHVGHLQRRVAWLDQRIAAYEGESDSYDRAEASAIRWALKQIDATHGATPVTLADLRSWFRCQATTNHTDAEVRYCHRHRWHRGEHR